jgi:hypothetical protein
MQVTAPRSPEPSRQVLALSVHPPFRTGSRRFSGPRGLARPRPFRPGGGASRPVPEAWSLPGTPFLQAGSPVSWRDHRGTNFSWKNVSGAGTFVRWGRSRASLPKALLKRSVERGMHRLRRMRPCVPGACDGGGRREWASSNALPASMRRPLSLGAVRFSFGREKGAVPLPGRRSVLASLLAGGPAVPFPGSSGEWRRRVLGKQIRPPGGGARRGRFYWPGWSGARAARRVHEVCITNGLQPAFLERGLKPSVPRSQFRPPVTASTGAPLRPGLSHRRHQARVPGRRIGPGRTSFIDFGRCAPCHRDPLPGLQEVCPPARRLSWF